MNEPMTVVRQFHRADSIAVSAELEKDAADLHFINGCLKLIILIKGNAILSINDKRCVVIAPSLLCLNETEIVTVEENLQANVSVIHFHPHYINHQLNYSIIRKPSFEASVTTRQDVHLFNAFLERHETYKGIMQLTDSNLLLLTQLCNAFAGEISEQDHRYWSCMARSYFIELLFKVVQLYTNYEPGLLHILKGRDEIVDAVILYLNTNYHEKITIETLCKRFNTNHTSLQTRFKKLTGEPVMHYLLKYAVSSMELAKDYLHQKTYPMTK